MKHIWRGMTVGAVLALALTGCQSPGLVALVPTGVGAAACALVSREPAAAGYVRLVGTTLSDLGRGEPPVPEALHAALAAVPADGLDPAAALGVWAGAAVAYAALYDASGTSAARTRAREALAAIGAALTSAAAHCGPGSPTPALASRSATPAVTEADAAPLARAVEREFQNVRRGDGP